MNWKNIRVYNNSQNNAFEELVCQLTREEVEFVKSQIVISRENNFFEGQGVEVI